MWPKGASILTRAAAAAALALLVLLPGHGLTAATSDAGESSGGSDGGVDGGILRSMVGPEPGVDAFLREHWPRKLLLIRRGNASFYHGHPTIRSSELEGMVAAYRETMARGGKVGNRLWRMAMFGEDYGANSTAAATTGAADAGDAAAEQWSRVRHFRGAVEQKFSLIAPQSDLRAPALGQLAEAFEEQFGLKTFVEVFYTPRTGRALPAHFDPVNVFAMQLEGKKRWVLHDAIYEQSRADLRFNLQEAGVELGAPILDVVMEPGDLLFIPSGIIHQAIAVGEEGEPASLHLGVGVESAVLGSWEALLLDLVARATDKAGEVAGLRCAGGDGERSLIEVLAAPLFTDARRLELPLLRWGDLVAVVLIHAASQKGEAGAVLRTAVPITEVVERAVGGAEGAARLVSEAAAILEGSAGLLGEAVRAMVETRKGKLGRHMPMGAGAGEKLKQRIVKSVRQEAQRQALLAAATEEDGGSSSLQEGLARALAQVACVLRDSGQAETVLRLFKQTCRRDLEDSRRRRAASLAQAASDTEAWLASVEERKDKEGAAAAAAAHVEL